MSCRPGLVLGPRRPRPLAPPPGREPPLWEGRAAARELRGVVGARDEPRLGVTAVVQHDLGGAGAIARGREGKQARVTASMRDGDKPRLAVHSCRGPARPAGGDGRGADLR